MSARSQMGIKGQSPSKRLDYTPIVVSSRADGVMKDLNAKALLSLIGLAIAMGLLLFIFAGTIHYWQAWLFLAVFMGTSTVITLYLMRYNPSLLGRRLKGGPTAERRPVQRFIMLWASIGFIGLLVIPALDFRFKWSSAPNGIVVFGDVLVVLGFLFTFRVYRENPFSSATIEVAAGQRVISTGPYAIVRHPMYASGLVYLIGIPLALGSFWGLLGLAIMLPFLMWRLFDEERFLAKNLPGYVEYQKRVRCRLVPFVW
jgi:protein-S-isoprenylcysteine O-methyltransferase Ste14